MAVAVRAHQALAGYPLRVSVCVYTCVELFSRHPKTARSGPRVAWCVAFKRIWRLSLTDCQRHKALACVACRAAALGVLSCHVARPCG